MSFPKHMIRSQKINDDNREVEGNVILFLKYN